MSKAAVDFKKQFKKFLFFVDFSCNVLMSIFLRGVAQHSTPITDKQKVQSRGLNNQFHGRRGRCIRRCNLDKELASARQVHVAGRLVSSGVKAEVNHQRALVIRGVDVRSAIGVRHVIAIERRGERIEDGNTVSNHLDSINGGNLNRIHIAARRLLRGRRRHRNGWRRVPCGNKHTINVHARRGAGRNVKNLINHRGHVVPVPVLVRVAGRGVVRRAHADEHVLDGPLKLRELSVRSAHVDSSNLTQMNADKREANSLNVNIMALVPVCVAYTQYKQLCLYHICKTDQSFPIDPQLPCLRAIPLSGWSRLYLERCYTSV